MHVLHDVVHDGGSMGRDIWLDGANLVEFSLSSFSMSKPLCSYDGLFLDHFPSFPYFKAQ